ncbi:MAG TPA: hypothetical protein VG347_04570 [Verrucomicrobiae bacterium]|nr:hypothetical protein [Verrucomicrobiae bacterium]
MDGWTIKDNVLTWLMLPIAAAMAGILIWALDRNPTWAPKLNTIITHRYWHSYNLKDLACLAAVILTLAFLAFLWVKGNLADRSEKKQQKAGLEWNRSLDPLIDINDYDEREYLFEDLDPDQRSKLFAALRHLPKGSRSLRQAVAIVATDLLEDID